MLEEKDLSAMFTHNEPSRVLSLHGVTGHTKYYKEYFMLFYIFINIRTNNTLYKYL